MYCHNCGQPVVETARFCSKCGARLQPADAQGTPAAAGPAQPPPLPAPPTGGATAVPVARAEKLLKEGKANHFKGVEAVGGTLLLTDRHLTFRSHAFNIQTHTESYPLESIVAVRPRNTLGLVPNGMAVTLRDGREERFVVFGRGEWMSAIIEAKARMPHV